MTGASEPLLELTGLTKRYPATSTRGQLGRRDELTVVDGVSLDVRPGECFGLVGESGSGKTTVARCIMKLLEPSDGDVQFEGQSLVRASRKELLELRPKLQMVFQHPESSLNPRFTIAQSVAEPLRMFRIASGTAERGRRVDELLELVGLSRHFGTRYPHELSGGQRQRVGIVRALASNPKLVVLDEPTSALDVSVQAQVLTLLQELQAELGTAYLFISHDLSTTRYLCDRVAVMQLGRIVECGEVDEVFTSPRHPYTKRLLAAVPRPPRPLASEALTGRMPPT